MKTATEPSREAIPAELRDALRAAEQLADLRASQLAAGNFQS